MRKKDSKELASAKGIFKGAQAFYKETLSELKGMYKSFFGREGGKHIEKKMQEALIATEDVKFTKAGQVTLSKEQRRDPSVITRIAETIKDFAFKPDTTLDKATIDAFNTGNRVASAAAIAYANRRLDTLRKAFGENSVLVRSIAEDMRSEGIIMTEKNRISGAKNKSLPLEELWKALDNTPSAKEMVMDTIQDLHSEKMSPDELKQQAKVIMKNPLTMENLGRIMGTLRGTASDYTAILKELYDAAPGDTAAPDVQADYQDLIESLAHKGRRLTVDEIDHIIGKINDYYKQIGGY